jgi:tetratricopeptide (TPR) repeat protein
MSPEMPPDPTRVSLPVPADAGPTQAVTEPEPGHTPLLVRAADAADLIAVPGYEVTRLIARGGMGAVYAARDLTLDREVAIKTLLPGADPTRFITEAKITARLPHPGIPPAHAIGTLPDGSPFLAMKLVQGHTLAQLLKDRPTPTADLPRFVQVFEQIAQAVGFAHSRGVIHRDLKPLNVMVGEFGEVQVMDWGLAKDATAAERAASVGPTALDAAGPTRAGVIMGTPGYMAPEQARGEAVGARADVFALGSVLAMILTGAPAFVGTTVRDTIAKTAAADLTDVSARLDGCGADAELVALARRCLSANAADRPADARAVADEVGAYRAGVEARLRQAETDRAKAETQAAEQRKRRRVVQWAAGTIAAVLVIGITGTAVGLIRAADARDREKDRADGEVREKEEKERQRDLALKREAEAVEARNKEAKARAEEERAQERTASVLDAMVSEVTGASLETQKGISEEQKKFLKQVLPYYQEFAAGRGNDEKSRSRVARAAYRVGMIEYRLGRHEEGAAALVRARDEYARLAAEFPALPEYRFELAGSHNDLGLLLKTLGKRGEAEAQYRAALALQEKLAAEFPALPKYRFELAGSHNNLGLLLDGLEKWSEAEAQYRAALALQEKLAAESPAVPEYRAGLAGSHNNLGLLLKTLGKRGEAEAQYRAALALQEKLAAEFPAVPEYRADLARSYNNLGVVLKDLRKWVEAEKWYKKGLDVRQKLAAEFPAVPEYRADLGANHYNLGNLLAGLKKWGEAEAQYRAALALQEKLAAEFLSAPEYRRDLARSHNNLGNLCLEQHKLQEAIAQARLTIKADPAYPYGHSLLGRALQQTGDITEARAALTEAVRLDPGFRVVLDALNKEFPPLPVAPPRAKK